MKKESIKRLIPSFIWKKIREARIVRKHGRIAAICDSLISSYLASPDDIGAVKAKRTFPGGTKIIWQYWAQGFDDIPDAVRDCLASVERYAGDYRIIRLSDATVQDYLDLPGFVLEKKSGYGYAHFSDLLRLLLLNAYGGIWMDATIMLSGPVPEEYLSRDFFAFQRDPEEPRKDYWENTYAYYFSWAKGFRVRLLNSFLVSKPHSEMISTLCGCMLKWWKGNDSLPDYFFFQILFDVLAGGRMKGCNCPIVSDCPPHFLQQYRNDPRFFIKSREEIFGLSTIHKLTYK